MTKQSNFTNGDTSNLSGIEKFCKQLVEDGNLSQLPSNYDCATLKMYISHLEKENAELKAKLENHRLMIMADGTVKQLYSVEEVEQIVKERDELKARLEKAVELPCKVGDEVYSILDFGTEFVLRGKCERVMYEKSAAVPEITVWCIFESEWQLHPRIFKNETLKYIFKTKEQAEQRLAELKGGDKE